MYPNLKALVRNLRMHAAPRRLTAVLSILTAFTLLFSFAASAQPVLAVPPPPTVNGLFYGDGDYLEQRYTAIAWGTETDTVLYSRVYSDTLYVALVIDGNFNDNAFDALPTTTYMRSAGWQVGSNVRSAFHLLNSEYAERQSERWISRHLPC